MQRSTPEENVYQKLVCKLAVDVFFEFQNEEISYWQAIGIFEAAKEMFIQDIQSGALSKEFPQ